MAGLVAGQRGAGVVLGLYVTVAAYGSISYDQGGTETWDTQLKSSPCETRSKKVHKAEKSWH